MNSNSIDWVNGQYYLAKRASALISEMGAGPFGYLTMQEIARRAAEMQNHNWLGYWESPRKALACTFRAVMLERNLPYLFMPVTYVLLGRSSVITGTETTRLRFEWAQSAERHLGTARTADREFSKLFSSINRPHWGLRLKRAEETPSKVKKFTLETWDENSLALERELYD